MVKLSKKTDYGLIAVRHLSRCGSGKPSSAKELAEAYGMPLELLAKVLQKLVKQGLLVSQHGAEGGYALAREASTITAFDVIRAIEGPIFITSCVTVRGECGQAPHCTVREPLSRINEVLAQALSSVRISDLGGGDRQLVQLDAPKSL
jgi:Rrf2 family protein